MVFSSAIFLYAFLPAVFLLSRVCKNRRWQNGLLAAASLVFYAFGQLQYVPLFLASVLINYISGLLLMREGKGRRAVLAVSVVLNLGILGVFKYTDFILGNVNALTGANLAMTGIVLPIGISFFTFQGMSYTIDVYRTPETGSRSFLKILLYIAFFPQLIAGPIVKYHDVAEQIDSRVCTSELTAEGMRRFIRGLGKKLLLANACGALTDGIFGTYIPASAGAADVRLMWLAAVSYMLQIYYDFSGYSDMAIGLGRMFGFRFLENFNFPYGAASIREFWRKWHISLSTWFKEYLYIPLGGNRCGKGRTGLNKLLVFLCTGIWHGANWTFIFWGLGHGLLSALEGAGIIPADRLQKSKAGRLLGRVYTLFAVCLLFVVFRADNLTQAFTVIGGMFAGSVTAAGSEWLALQLTPAAIAAMAVAVLCAGNLIPAVRSRLSPGGSLRLTAANGLHLLLLVLCMLKLALGGFNPFIYFQF